MWTGNQAAEQIACSDRSARGVVGLICFLVVPTHPTARSVERLLFVWLVIDVPDFPA